MPFIYSAIGAYSPGRLLGGNRAGRNIACTSACDVEKIANYLFNSLDFFRAVVKFKVEQMSQKSD